VESWVVLWRRERRDVMWWPLCCGELGGAVEVRKEGCDMEALGAVESWVVLWRCERRVMMRWPWCWGGLDGAVEVREEGS
jgi:hypothetical protein